MAKKSMIAREKKREKLVQKYAQKRAALRNNLKAHRASVKWLHFTVNSNNFLVIVHRFVYITVVSKPAVQKVITVILDFRATFYVRWHTSVSFLEYEKQVGKVCIAGEPAREILNP